MAQYNLGMYWIDCDWKQECSVAPKWVLIPQDHNDIVVHATYAFGNEHARPGVMWVDSGKTDGFRMAINDISWKGVVSHGGAIIEWEGHPTWYRCHKPLCLSGEWVAQNSLHAHMGVLIFRKSIY